MGHTGATTASADTISRSRSASEHTRGRSDLGDVWFCSLFDGEFRSVHRFLVRFTGDAELAGELAQEVFVRLYRRGSRPDEPRAWLFTVAMNLARNAKSKASRRHRLLTVDRSTHVLSDPPPAPGDSLAAAESKRRVRAALGTMSERDRQMLLLRAEGYSYRQLARALDLNEASVGTQLSRAKSAFKRAYEGIDHAP